MAIALTRADLITYLRMRLNDTLKGNNTSGAYTDTEMGFCIDLAYRETVVAAKTNTATVSLSLTSGTATYDTTTVFEPISVTHNSIILEKTTIGDLEAAIPSFSATAAGTPVKWLHTTGGTIMLYPKPDGTADDYAAIVYGYAYPTDMGSSDTPDALADGYAVSALLDRAEAEARMMRSSYGANPQLAELRMGNWRRWVDSMIQGRKS